MNKEETVIMYDSTEAARVETREVWVSGPGRTGHTFIHQDERSARYAGCTHQLCKCGAVIPKSRIHCDVCYEPIQMELYLKKPFKEWNGSDPVVTAFSATYFFSEDDLEAFMEENQIDEIELLLCDPCGYQKVGVEDITTDDVHEEYECPGELVKRVAELNKYIDTLSPHSWSPGSIRTSYKRQKTEE